MKRSLIRYVVPLSLALLFLGGCAGSGEELSSDGTVTQENGISLTQQASYAYEYTNMTVSLPEDWAWEEITAAEEPTTDGEDASFGLRFWPKADDTAVVELTARGGGLTCGTVSSREDVVYENGYDATVATDIFDDQSIHVNVRYTDVPGKYYVNYRWTSDQNETYGGTVQEILDHVVLAADIIREDDALALAESYKDEEDQKLRAEFDDVTGHWSVGVYPYIGGKTPVKTVVFDASGSYLTTETP